MKSEELKEPEGVLKEEVKDLIRKDLLTLKEDINDQPTYEHIIKTVLNMQVNEQTTNQVLDILERDVPFLVDSDNIDTWGAAYHLTTFIEGRHTLLSHIYSDDEDLRTNAELKTEVIGEIINFIHDNY